MLKKYLTKFTVDILPSVAATVIGAYIVNHYIVSKPGADAPVAAVVSTAAPEAAKVDLKAPAKTPGASSDLANVREPGVKAKGISERAILEKTAAEKPAENVTDKPAETASIPAETRRHQPAPREKTVAKSVPPAPVPPAPVPPASVPAATPAVVPVVSAPATVPPEAVTAPEERRDANDLARAAIDRLRGSNEGLPRAQEAARAPEAPRVAPGPVRVPDTPRVVSAPALRPLPPPVMVSTPPIETRIDDPSRPTPPTDIPSRPLDLRAEAAGPLARERTTVAEDVLSAAKSVFHAVLPK